MMVIKHKKVLLLMIVFLIISIASGCSPGADKGTNRNNYFIDVYYNSSGKSIFGSQRLSYKNTEDVELKDIYFHLYPNAFKDKDTSPMIGSLGSNYPNGFNPGQIDIIGVWADGSPIKWELEGEADTILRIKLGKPLKINKNIDIKIDFQEKLPYARTDFGIYDGIACFENWYPVLCIYDNEGWHKEAYAKFGEANFSEISDYTVCVNLLEDEIVASTGRCIKESKYKNNRKVVTLKADNVRDFTWISSSNFKKVEKKYKGVVIKSYFLDRDKVRGIAVLDICARALEFFNGIFGEYPYDNFSIVETCLYGGAMEYPMLTSVGEQYYEFSDERVLEGAVVHELAHQWWYVVVGNNEYEEPWLDEALATYSEAMYYEKYYGIDMLKNRINPNVGMVRYKTNPGDSVGEFSNLNEYNMVIYIKGAYILHELREHIGDEKFLEIIRKYYSTNKYRNTNIDGFLSAVNDICGSEAVKFMKLRLSGTE